MLRIAIARTEYVSHALRFHARSGCILRRTEAVLSAHIFAVRKDNAARACASRVIVCERVQSAEANLLTGRVSPLLR